MRHKTKIVKYKSKKAAIDVKIANLILMLWKCGIETYSCCEAECNFACNHKTKITKYKRYWYHKTTKTKHCYNNVWIAFKSSKDVEKLYNIVAKGEWSKNNHRNPNSMYSIMGCDLFLETSQKYMGSSDKWSFAFVMMNEGVNGHWGRPVFNNKRETREMWVYDSCDKNDFVIAPQLTFPQKHVAFVENKLTEYLQTLRAHK